MKSSAVEVLQRSHIENIAAFLGESCSPATKVLPTATGRSFSCLLQGTSQKENLHLLASLPF